MIELRVGGRPAYGNGVRDGRKERVVSGRHRGTAAAASDHDSANAVDQLRVRDRGWPRGSFDADCFLTVAKAHVYQLLRRQVVNPERGICVAVRAHRLLV